MSEPSNHPPAELRTRLGIFFSRAVEAVGELKDVVVRSSQIGKIKLDTSALRRDRDQALQRLGAAMLERAEQGELELPAALDGLLAEIRALDDRLEAQDAEIAAVEAEARMQREASRLESRAARELEASLADDKYETWAEEPAPPADDPGPDRKTAG